MGNSNYTTCHIPGVFLTDPFPFFKSTIHWFSLPPLAVILNRNTPLTFFTNTSPSCERMHSALALLSLS